MRAIITALALWAASFASAQAIHDYASVEFSPNLRKLGVFSTTLPEKVVDLKAMHMSKRGLDIVSFFQEVQELERQGWEVTSQDVVALDRGQHMYVWSLRKARQ